MPDPDEWVGPQQGDDVFTERGVEGRIPEHRRHVDGEIQKQLLHHLGLVKDPLLQRAHARKPFLLDSLPQPATDRCVCVSAEIEAVVAEDSLQQQLDLDSLEIGLERLPFGLALGFRSRCYLYSHTRRSERSCSVSTGLVM